MKDDRYALSLLYIYLDICIDICITHIYVYIKLIEEVKYMNKNRRSPDMKVLTVKLGLD